MIRSFSLAALAVACVSVSAHAQAEEDELVRLPGQGELRDDSLRQRAQADRLKPGAGLFITFDTNNDGRISQAELDAGIPAAFTQADSNEDGYLTALEQQDWARSLPVECDLAPSGCAGLSRVRRGRFVVSRPNNGYCGLGGQPLWRIADDCLSGVRTGR